jgi:hypothetical protein
MNAKQRVEPLGALKTRFENNMNRRYGKVFVYHNGASAYFAGRGFRGSLRV